MLQIETLSSDDDYVWTIFRLYEKYVIMVFPNL